jgi:hypothetical protein
LSCPLRAARHRSSFSVWERSGFIDSAVARPVANKEAAIAQAEAASLLAPALANDIPSSSRYQKLKNGV